MVLSPGQMLSHYRLVEKIGEGGMGVVWKAVDTTLDREVAIKVLPAEVIADGQRVERFQREARLLASLSHPHIAGLFGLHEDGGTRFLSMELIPGEELADRIGRGPLPVDEVIRIGLQMADALEAAHDSGIIHRDLKPANIKLTPAGTVKVLDFGLAKALDTAPPDSPRVTQSPTITALATQAGVLMGTAAYMSPEQARGEAVDRRADIWAFGCILLEMLSGKTTFGERTVSDTLAAVLKSEPDWDALPAGTPASLRRLIHRCLVKDARRRLRDVGEIRISLEDLQAGAPEKMEEQAPGSPAPAAPRRLWPSALAAAALAAAVTAVALLSWQPASQPEVPLRFTLEFRDIGSDDRYRPALSPDGRRVVFGRKGMLWLRTVTDLNARPLPGTEGAILPFWSPDGQEIAFLKQRSLWRMPIDANQPTLITAKLGAFGQGSGFTWQESGRIVFTYANAEGLWSVSSRGGDPVSLLKPDLEAESDFHHPQTLPAGAAFMVATHTALHGPNRLEVIRDGRRDVILESEGGPIWTPVYSPTGHILYRRTQGTEGLWAVPFSLARMTTTGAPFMIDPEGSFPQAAAGSIVYVRGANIMQRFLVWMDREGKVIERIGRAQYSITAPSLSPDGRRAVAMGRDQDNWGIWIHDLDSGLRTRLNFGGVQDWHPTWTPDGRHVVFWDGASRTISWLPADGTGRIEPLVTERFADSGDPGLTPDGGTLYFWGREGDRPSALYVRSLDGDEPSRPFLVAEGNLTQPRLSPEGTLMAYASDETGGNKIYLTAFPSGDGKWQVSHDNGEHPRWRGDGKALYFLDGGTLMEVEIRRDPGVRIGAPRPLFDVEGTGAYLTGTMSFDVAPDGQRFLMVAPEESESGAEIVMHRNWLAAFGEGGAAP